jgi:hypothetical protein
MDLQIFHSNEKTKAMNDSLGLIYNAAFFERLCPVLENCIPAFDRKHFIFRVFDTRWPDMNLAERETHIARVLHDFLPQDFSKAASSINAVAANLKEVGKHGAGVEVAFLGKYVELYCDGHAGTSIQCLTGVKKRSGIAHPHEAPARAESQF